MPSNAFQLGKLLISSGEVKISPEAVSDEFSTIEQAASTDALTATGNAVGDQRVVGNNLYIWNGSGWYRIALINASPTWDSGGQPSASYTLDADSPQDATIITLAASDPDGLPIQYSHITSGSMDSMATISQDSSVFTITPKTITEVGEGVELTGSVTFRASDGVNVLPYVSSFTLSFIFIIENSKYTTLLATATGTGDNNNITDSSSNNETITVYGNPSAGTFSPYRNNYSTYFDGNDNYTVPDGLHLGTGDFTFEFWIWMDEDTTTTQRTFISGETSGTGVGWRFTQDTYGGYNGLTFGYGQYGSYTVGKYVNNYWLPNGEWTHLAAQRRSGTIEIYINGVSQTLTTYNENGTFSDGANLTSTQTSRTFFSNVKGYVADLRLVTGSYVYDGNFTPSTENITAVTNTVLLTNQNQFPYLVDNSSNAYAITVNGNTSIKPFSRHDTDEYTSTDHGGSVYFDQASNLTLADNDNWDLTSSNFTIKFWVYMQQDTFPSGYIKWIDDNQSTTSTQGNWTLGMQSNKQVRLIIRDTSGTLTINTYSGTSKLIHNNQWYYVEWSGGTVKVNGETYISYTHPSTGAIGGNMVIGSGQNHQGTREAYMKGYIADLHFVNGSTATESSIPTAPMSSVSDTKLLIKGTGASIIDKSQSTNLQLTGNTTGSTTQVKFSGFKSMYFDGNGGYLNIPAGYIPDLGAEDWTFETWVYAPVAGDLYILSQGVAGGNIPFSEIRILTNGSIRVGTYGGPLNNLDFLVIKTTAVDLISAATWHHLAITHEYNGSNGGTYKIYVDGSLPATGSVSYTNNGYWNTAGVTGEHWEIGRRVYYGTQQTVEMYLQDLRITKGLARYTANFTPPTEPLKA